jgi:hypothetical protein
MLFDKRNKNVYGLGTGEGVKMVCEILGHFLFKGNKTTAYGHSVHSIRCYLTQEYIIIVRVGISVFYGILGHFLFEGGRDDHI